MVLANVPAASACPLAWGARSAPPGLAAEVPAGHLLPPLLLLLLPYPLLQALQDEFGPLEGHDASKIPYPSHHLPGATLRGFPMKPWALLNSRWGHAQGCCMLGVMAFSRLARGGPAAGVMQEVQLAVEWSILSSSRRGTGRQVATVGGMASAQQQSGLCWVLSWCRFKEVLMLDADVVPMRDPSYMFDAPEYRKNGNYFWGDIYGEGMFNDAAFDYVGRWLLAGCGGRQHDC